MRFTLYILALFLVILNLEAQETKRESESKIAQSEVPSECRDWLSKAFPQIHKVKWYKEVTSGKQSYEAKFKSEGARYSIEFSENGLIEDVEKKVSLNDLRTDLRLKLNQGFSQFEKFKLIKLQEQWTAATPETLLRAIKNKDQSLATIRFEVEFKAIVEGKYSLWEGLFSAEGQLLSKRPIVLRPTDNLDY